MDSYDGAELCELVKLYLLSQLQNLNINLGLYRDDGLVVTNQTPREAGMAKRRLCRIFKENDLKISVEANKKVADFLDITLDLGTGSYKPYKKPDDIISYIHCQSNHLPSIIKNVPKGIGIRLSTNSANADIFQESAKPYNNVLKNNGHKYTNKGAIQNKRGKASINSDPKIFELPTNNTRNAKEENNNKMKRREITRFNHLYSKNVPTNIGITILYITQRLLPSKQQALLNQKQKTRSNSATAA